MRNYDIEKEMSSKREFDLMNSIDAHPNICKAVEFITTENWTYTIMELAVGLELQEFVFKNAESINIKIIKQITKQLLEAISHLHKLKICHKDIKPENIMVNMTGKDEVSIKLIDFNVSQQVKDGNQSMLSQTGTQAFKAPEMLANKYFNEKIDEWGAGCILCFMLTGKMPDNGCGEHDINSKYEFQTLEDNEKYLKLPTNQKDLLTKLCTFQLESRISALSALIHPWFLEDENKNE